jgi:NAD(P)-dependent dehydrogenase (short-subunit alcohol dehydrogenase family)
MKRTYNNTAGTSCTGSADPVRTAVVTGGGRGIGLEIARKLGAQGYAVLLTTRDAEAGRRAAAAVGPNAWAAALDVRDPDGHKAVAAQATARGPLAVWVNNAGVLSTKKAWELDDNEIWLMVETNLLGTISGCRAAVDAIGPIGGHIINVASMSGLGPVPGFSVYAATKHAVVGFTTSLQGDLDLAGRPIRVHAVCPDAVSTDMVTSRSDDPEAAILFSGKHLSAAQVAAEAVAMLDSNKLIQPLPRARGVAMRGAWVWPRAGLRALSVARKVGESRNGR